MFHRYLYGFEDYCTSSGITFRMDLPFKATENSHKGNNMEGPAKSANNVKPKPDPLTTKNVVKVLIPLLAAFKLQ